MKNVDIAVIVEILGTGSPAPGAIADVGRIGNVGEYAITVIFIQSVAAYAPDILFFVFAAPKIDAGNKPV